MSLYDRDYYREDSSRQTMLSGMAPTCKLLIAINVCVFILQMLPGSRVTSWLMLSPEDVVERFQIWRLLTSAFCHDPNGLWHLLFNMLALWWFGSPLESIYGPREFLKFYLTAAILSATGYLGVELLLHRIYGHPPAPEVGASGAIMAVLMLCALYYPTMKVYIMFVIPVELRWLVAIYVVFDLHPLLLRLGGSEAVDRVAHATHLAGLLYGYLYMKFDLRFSRLFADWDWPSVMRKVRASSRQRKVKLYTPPRETPGTDDLKRRVDEILAKISARGEASLTDSEREILKEASRRYKKD
jgi:membrane associated rhomboid family serine protease